MDLILEIFRAFVIGAVLLFLVFKPRRSVLYKVPGWRFIVAGFFLLFFGNLIDITDNFESLNKYIFIGDTEYQAILEKIIGYLLGLLFLAIGFWNWLPKVMEHEKQARNNLEKAVKEVKNLSGLLPICSSCKKVRDDKGYWNQIESYIESHSEADFSHSICPECAKKLYPDLDIYD